MLHTSGLDGCLEATTQIAGADCILAKAAWNDGRRVDLRQHRAAARTRGIPFLLVPSLRARDVLLALVPLLLERHLLRSITRADAPPAPLTLTRRDGGDSSTTSSRSDGTCTAVVRGTGEPLAPLKPKRHDDADSGSGDGSSSTSSRSDGAAVVRGTGSARGSEGGEGGAIVVVDDVGVSDSDRGSGSHCRSSRSGSSSDGAGTAHAMPPARVAELQARVLSGELPLHALLAECLGQR
ncbi:hypothetical protein FOA52_008284 [Chlamydomonas sp. UWO 241]|nr:hypothetical protein FOA52_008284 [Chlamydomonas sp. UWO 241]